MNHLQGWWRCRYKAKSKTCSWCSLSPLRPCSLNLLRCCGLWSMHDECAAGSGCATQTERDRQRKRGQNNLKLDQQKIDIFLSTDKWNAVKRLFFFLQHERNGSGRNKSTRNEFSEMTQKRSVSGERVQIVSKIKWCGHDTDKISRWGNQKRKEVTRYKQQFYSDAAAEQRPR